MRRKITIFLSRRPQQVSLGLLILMSANALPATAQLHIHGTTVSVPATAQLAILGDLDIHTATLQGEQPIILEGRFMLHGQLTDHTDIGAIRPGSTGRMELLGGADQILRGKARLYLPTLELLKTGGQVTAGTDLEIAQQLRFSSATVLQAAGQDISLRAISSRLTGEAADRYVVGEEASVTGPTDFFLAAESTSTDLLGIGLEAGTIGGAAVDPFRVKRVHRIEGGVGKQGSISRVYEIEAGNASVLSSLAFTYLPHEIPAGYTESQFKLFASHDNGATWLPIAATGNAAANRLTASNYELPQGTTWLTVAEACDPVVPAITSSKALQNGVVNQCPDESITLSYGGPATTYHWSEEGSGDTLALNSNVTLNAPGRYQLTVRTSRGCVFTNVVEIIPQSNPILDISFSPDPSVQLICLGTDVNLSVTSDQTLSTASWDLEGIATTGETVNHTFFTEGNKTIMVTGTSQFGCVSTTTESFRLLPRPTATITLPKSTLCQEETINAEAVAELEFEGSSFSLNYEWTYDGTTGNASSFEAIANRTGENRLKLLVEPSLPHVGCTVVVDEPITVNHKPVAAFQIRKNEQPVTQSCEGEYIDLFNQSSVGNNATLQYAWDFGDGRVSSDVSPGHQFLTAATRDIRLIATSQSTGCADTLITAHLVNEVPKGQFFLSDNRICLGDTLLIQNDSYTQSDSFTSRWSFGNGITQVNDQNQFSYTYGLAGEYRIRLERTTSNGCSNSVEKILSVYDNPKVDFAIDQTACAGELISSENLTTISRGVISQYQWYVDGQLVSTSTNFSRVFTEGTDTEIKLLASTNQGCDAEIVKTIGVRDNFSVSKINSLFCQDTAQVDLSQSVSPSISEAEIIWKAPTGQVVGTNPIQAITQSGLYSVSIVDEYCESELLVPVTLAFAQNQIESLEICDEEVFDPDFSVSPASVQWSIEGTELASTRAVRLEKEGLYSLRAEFEFENETCLYSNDIQVRKISRPEYDFADSLGACEGDLIPLVANDTSFQYQWVNLTTGELISSNSITVNESADLDISAVKSHCTFNDTITVDFASNPIVSFAPSQQSYCEGDSATLLNQSFDQSGGSLSYRWLGNDIFLSEEINPTFVLSDTGSLEVELVATTSFGCSSSVSKVLSPVVLDPVILNIDQPCTDSEVFFEISSTDISNDYHWSFADGQVFSGDQVSKVFDESGPQQVTLTVKKNNCRFDSLFSIEVQKPLRTPFESRYATCNDSLVLEYKGEEQFSWVGNGSERIDYQGNLAVFKEGDTLSYSLKNDQGCSLIDSVIVELGGLPTDFLPDSVRSCTEVEFEVPFVEGGGYMWSDGYTGRERLIQFPGRYVVNISTSDGCESSDTVNVDIDRISTFDFPASVSACKGEIVQFSIPQSVENFRWLDGYQGRNRLIETSTSLSLTVGNKYCKDTLLSDVRFAPVPDFELPTDSQICYGESFEIIMPEDQHIEYLWLWNKEPVFSGDVFWTRPEILGTSDLVVEATNQFGCTARDSLQVTVNPIPEFNVSAGPTCEGDTAFFEISSNLGVDLSFDWHNYVRVSEQYPHNFYLPNYQGIPITGDAFNEYGCTAPVIVSPNLLRSPSISIEDQLVECSDSLTLQLDEDYRQILWSNGDESRGTTYRRSGLESVLVVGNNGCEARADFDVLLNAIDEGQLYDEYESCGPLHLAIKNTENTIIWEQNNSVISRSSRVTFNQAGSFILRLTDEKGCSYQHEFTVNVKANPVLTLQDQYSVCGDLFEFLLDSTDLSTITWQDGRSGFRRMLTKPGNYAVEAVGQNGCAVKDSFQLAFRANPPEILSDSIENCGSLTVSIPDSLNVLWSNQSISNTRVISDSGRYWARVTNNSACSVVDSMAVTINPVPEIDLGPDRTLCYGDAVELRVDSRYNKVLWNNGRSDDFITVNSPGTYWVEVSNDFGCEASDVINVNYRNRLVPDLGDITYICSEEGVWLTTRLEVENYKWFTGADMISNNDSLLVFEPGDYSLEVSDKYGCIGTESIRVVDSGAPIEASFLVASVARPGEDILFSLLTEPLPMQVAWDFGDGTTSDQFYPTHRYLTTGVKRIMLEVFNEQCIDREIKEILITDQDIIDFSNDSTELILKRIEISPNPTSDILKVELELNIPGSADLFVFDLLGNERLNSSELVFEDSLFLDLSGFNPGVYFLFIQVGPKVVMRRIIKI